VRRAFSRVDGDYRAADIPPRWTSSGLPRFHCGPAKFSEGVWVTGNPSAKGTHPPPPTPGGGRAAKASPGCDGEHRGVHRPDRNGITRPARPGQRQRPASSHPLVDVGLLPRTNGTTRATTRMPRLVDRGAGNCSRNPRDGSLRRCSHAYTLPGRPGGRWMFIATPKTALAVRHSISSEGRQPTRSARTVGGWRRDAATLHSGAGAARRLFYPAVAHGSTGLTVDDPAAAREALEPDDQPPVAAADLGYDLRRRGSRAFICRIIEEAAALGDQPNMDAEAWEIAIPDAKRRPCCGDHRGAARAAGRHYPVANATSPPAGWEVRQQLTRRLSARGAGHRPAGEASTQKLHGPVCRLVYRRDSFERRRGPGKTRRVTFARRCGGQSASGDRP